nr:septum formation initiator family protein [uncultured Sphaerochaeta sp.]
MTRKIQLLFAFSLVFIFSLLMTVFGIGGILHNRALKAEISRLSYEQTMFSIQVDSLKRQRDEASSEDALKDAAFKYGYQSEGEQVYYFMDDEHNANTYEDSILRTFESGKSLGFSGIPTIYLALASLAMAAMITLCYWWMQKRRRHTYELER